MLPKSISDKYLPFLASVLTRPRLQHSLGVMRVMGELTEIYDLDPTQALLAGLLRCGWLREYFEHANVPIHPNLEQKFQTLSDQLQGAESFFERW